MFQRAAAAGVAGAHCCPNIRFQADRRLDTQRT